MFILATNVTVMSASVCSSGNIFTFARASWQLVGPLYEVLLFFSFIHAVKAVVLT